MAEPLAVGLCRVWIPAAAGNDGEETAISLALPPAVVQNAAARYTFPASSRMRSMMATTVSCTTDCNSMRSVMTITAP